MAVVGPVGAGKVVYSGILHCHCMNFSTVQFAPVYIERASCYTYRCRKVFKISLVTLHATCCMPMVQHTVTCTMDKIIYLP